MKTDIFLPPGVQRRLYERLGRCPRQLPLAPAATIERLWRRRNEAPEEQLPAVDADIEAIVLACHRRTEQHNHRGLGDERTWVYPLPCRDPRDYWASVTDVLCPACAAGGVEGMLRWAEAGYVPGYRICDGCGRHYLARGDSVAPEVHHLRRSS